MLSVQPVKFRCTRENIDANESVCEDPQLSIDYKSFLTPSERHVEQFTWRFELEGM